MFPATSPLIEQANLKGVFVKSTADWNAFGCEDWAAMMDCLRAQEPTRRVMGIDTEWFLKNPLATVQVATATHCFVIHLSYLDNRVLPAAVKNAFHDETVIKCGVGISGDVKRLQNEQQLVMNTVMDLGDYGTLVELAEFGKTNLGALAESVCGVTMLKDHFITRSNWELPLTQEQFSYAADDAVASYLVGDRIMQEAVNKFSLEAATFNAAKWLSQTKANAAAALKHAVRARQRELVEKQRQAAAAAAAGAATGEGGGVLPVVPQSSVRVRVLNKEGAFLFDCSQGRAKFYVEEKGIAVVTKTRPGDPRKPLEIQLKFENQTRTRLCMYHAVGQCELGEHCPFAHGVDQLCEASRELLKDSTTVTCAFCLAPKNLMRHTIVPPSFRKFLPKPFRFPKEEDYVPICTQCNTFIRHYYDFYMKQIYVEAECADELGKVQMEQVAKSVGYAGLLLDAKKLAKVPLPRQEQLKQYILTNWTATRMYDKAEGQGTRPGRVAEVALESRGQCEVSNDADDNGEGAAGQPQAGHTPSGSKNTDFGDDWESLEGDDAAATCAEAERQQQEHEKETSPQPQSCQYAFFVDRNGTKVPVRDPETGDINTDFLERLSHIVPGEVRARVTMQTLIGSDKEKAAAFVERWRTFCMSSCGMLEKPSNHLTAEQWEQLVKSNNKGASS